jgi:polar amino acid transport system permease protein
MLALDFELDVVRRYLFHHLVIEAAWVTLRIAILSQLLGIALGIGFAFMRVSRNPVLNAVAGFYVWFFRGTPVLLQLLLLYFGLPQVIESDWFTQELTATRAAVIAFAINEGAYMSEIIRAGILSVEGGQGDAAQSLGMTRLQALRRIILPQAFRVVLPPTGNEFIAMLKNTSIASVISVVELTHRANLIYNSNFKFMELLVVAGFWYLAMTTVLSIGQAELERWLSAGERDRPETLFSRALGVMGRSRGI